MGAKRNVIFFFVVAESRILFAVEVEVLEDCSSLVAFVLLYTQYVLNSALQVTCAMPTPVEISNKAGLTLFGVISIGTTSSLWPAFRSCTMNPNNAIQSEEMWSSISHSAIFF